MTKTKKLQPQNLHNFGVGSCPHSQTLQTKTPPVPNTAASPKHRRQRHRTPQQSPSPQKLPNDSAVLLPPVLAQGSLGRGGAGSALVEPVTGVGPGTGAGHPLICLQAGASATLFADGWGQLVSLQTLQAHETSFTIRTCLLLGAAGTLAKSRNRASCS